MKYNPNPAPSSQSARWEIFLVVILEPRNHQFLAWTSEIAKRFFLGDLHNHNFDKNSQDTSKMLEKSNLRHSVDFLHVNLSTTISRPRRSIFLGYINVLRYVLLNNNMNPFHFLSKNDMNPVLIRKWFDFFMVHKGYKHTIVIRFEVKHFNFKSE